MSVALAPTFPPSTESSVEPAVVRLAQTPNSVSGNSSARENNTSQILGSQSSVPQDEVKVQMEPPGEIAVYQFLNQYGTLVLQVPPQQVLNLAQQISTELARQAAAHPAIEAEKGEDNGH
jgi:hypothetical protein